MNTGFSNWLLQVLEITWFNLRTIPARRGAAFSAAVGIAGVVAVLVGVLAISEGFQKAMTVSGADDVAVVLRTGADSELTSTLSRDETRLVTDGSGIARGAQGPLVSSELFVIVELPKRTTHTGANVPFRGVDPTAFEVRGDMTMVRGRRFEPGKNEVIVGVGAAREFDGLEIGAPVRIGQNTWQVVGQFSARGGVSESEVWTDAAVLQPAYHRGDSFQAVYARLTSASAFSAFKDSLTSNPQLHVKVATLRDFYAEHSSLLIMIIHYIGYTIAVLMGLGALFGALNTMYSAVATRTREIATLRALGFGSGPVVISVIIESTVIALTGGAIGAILAYVIFDGFTAATMNFQTFTQVTFAFAVTPRLLVQATILAALLGLIGGVFPAYRAAHLPIATGLRES